MSKYSVTAIPVVPMPPAPRTSRKLIRYSQVSKQPVEWLWPNRIALGKLTLLVGEPGLGKGLVTIDLAARVSRGTPWPDQPESCAPLGSTLLFHAEDDQFDTVPSRLEAAGADLEKIIALDTRPSDDGSQPFQQFSLPEELTALGAALAQAPDCKLVVIDPISAYLGQSDGNQNGQSRTLMYALAEVARVHRVAIVAVAHLNKRASSASINRVMGALSFVSTARTVWGIFRDPADAGRRLMMSLKNNVSEDHRGLSFQLRTPSAQPAPSIEWGQPVVETSIHALLFPKRFNLGEREYHDKERFLVARLREVLSIGPMKRQDLLLLVPGSEEQLYRAADKLGVVKAKGAISKAGSGCCRKISRHGARNSSRNISPKSKPGIAAKAKSGEQRGRRKRQRTKVERLRESRTLMLRSGIFFV